MKRRQVEVEIADHAVLRYLERQFGLDVEAVRAKIAGHAIEGAELRAIGVCIGMVRLVLEEDGLAEDGVARVAVTTVTLKQWPNRSAGRLLRNG